MQIDGAKLRAARKARKLTQEDLAKGICSAPMISQIENGKANPSEYVLKRLCDRMDIEVSELQK